MTKPPKQIVDALARTGLPYHFAQGSRHIHIRLCDRIVGIIPRDGKAREGRAMKNVVCQIRRTARELSQ